MSWEDRSQTETCNPGPFMGVPYLLKDSFMDYEGTVSTQCCKMFKEYVSTFDMGSVTSAKGAGFLLVAKTTAPECGWELTDRVSALR